MVGRRAWSATTSPAVWELFLVKCEMHELYKPVTAAGKVDGKLAAMIALAERVNAGKRVALHGSLDRGRGAPQVAGASDDLRAEGEGDTDDADEALRGFGQGPKVKRGGRP